MKDLDTPDKRNVSFNITLDGLKSSLNEVTVSEKIPENIRKMIELAQKTYLYAYYEYDFFALSTLYLSLLMETAMKERFLKELPDEIEMERCGEIIVARKSYRTIYGYLWQGWKIKGQESINASLKSIILWIKNSDLLPQRYKVIDIDIIRHFRNTAAHLEDKDGITPAIAQLFYCRTIDIINCLFDPKTHTTEPIIFTQTRELYRKIHKMINEMNNSRQ